MDKTEYNQKLDELSAYMQNKDYAQALEIVDSIDWRRVKSIRTLNMAADVYERNKEYEKEKEVLKIAYNHSSIGRSVLSRLVEVNLKMGDLEDAERYFREFSKVALNDNSRCLLQYKLYKAKNAPLDAQIAVLEEYREREYTERWAYELAKLYAKAGDRKKCVETCDDLILWFSEGKYVVRAMELKMRYEPLSPSQKALYSEIKATGYRQQPKEEPGTGPEDAAGMAADGSAEASAAQTPMSTADMDAERIALILSGKYGQEETEDSAAGPEETETAADAQDAAAAEADGGQAEEASDEVDLSDLDEEDEEEESADTDVPAARRAETHAEPEVFRNRIFRSFQDVFSNLSRDDTDGRIERPEEDDSAMEEEPVDFRVRELEPEEEAGREAAEPSRPKNSEYIGMRTEDFNLDDFLSETMGSFAGELASGSFEGASTTTIVPDTGSIDLPDSSRKEAVQNTGVVAPSVEESLTGLRFERPEETASEEETSLQEETAPEMETAPEEESAQEESVAEEDIPEEPVPEEDIPEEPVLEEGMQEESGAEENAREESGAGEYVQEEPAGPEAESGDSSSDVLTEEAFLTDGMSADELVIEEAENGWELEEAAAAEQAAEEQKYVSEEQEAAEEAHPETDSAEGDAGKRIPAYNEELEVPDPEPSEEDRRSRTITLSQIGQNTVPVSLNRILSSETPEERRIRILNKAKPTRMSEEQRRIFTYFARIPGMDTQILEALNGVYRHAGERTSLHGNIAVMGAVGTGKSRLTHGLIVAMCQDMGLDAAKVARISGGEMNQKDPAHVVDVMSGGFLAIEDVSLMTADTVQKLNQAMEFRTDCMVLIIEDEKTNLRSFLKKHPQFAAKFEKVISIPVFTNDELVTFARTYATENGCKMDDLGILALYTKIGSNQTEEEPMTIARVKEMVDDAIHHASRGRKKNKRGKDKDRDRWMILHEKDFE